ncbi:unnamed protein product, partial [Onchocerca flexuosa]|uniref:PID domain-containing protein n=1 Tax=Onchocerca flexuosa TaxID=387005 RepID=A0A183HPB5_9BILA
VLLTLPNITIFLRSRDSYLKRVQREENQSNEEIMEVNKNAEKLEPTSDEAINETESLLSKDEQGGDDGIKAKKGSKKEVIVHEPAVLIEGVLFRARYLGSTQLICEGRPTKASRMMQAQEAVARVKVRKILFYFIKISKLSE